MLRYRLRFTLNGAFVFLGVAYSGDPHMLPWALPRWPGPSHRCKKRDTTSVITPFTNIATKQ